MASVLRTALSPVPWCAPHLHSSSSVSFWCAPHQQWQHYHRHRLWDQLQRWRRNFSRLYARRLLEIALASAASSRFVTELEAAVAIERPVDWHDWQRRDWTEELLASIGHTRLARGWTALSRVASLTLLAAPLAVLAPLSYVSDTAHRWSWSYGIYAVEQAGPTFIKLVQWATTRQDLFSPEFCQYFGKLRDNTVGHDWTATAQILERDLGPEASQRLQLNTVPIGSGCIAQVYKGVLLEATGQYSAGTEVAVKVQHPHIWEKVCVDFYLLGKAAYWLESIPYLNIKYLALSDSVRQFRDIMLPQLDMTLEAKHLNRFNRNFADDDQVSFPKPLGDLTTTHVLTETLVHGTPIMDYLQAPPEVKKALAILGLNTTLRMIFLHDFIHGDLHPGNILVSQLPGSGKLQLNLLDCGLVLEMGPEQHKNLVQVLSAFVQKDGRLAGQLMVDTSSDCQASPWDIEMFVAGIEQIIVADASQNFIEKVGEYIADICFLACRHHVKLEAAFINAALAIEIMEGIATALYPDLVVKKEALPLVVKAELMHNISRFKPW